jgi:membrane protease subunit HflC
MRTGNRYTLPAAAAILLLLLYLTFFSVRETEFVLVTQFGRPLYTVTDAGLHVKWPFQSALRFDRRLRIYNPRPSEFLTRRTLS